MGFKCTAGGHATTAHPAGMVYPALTLGFMLRQGVHEFISLVTIEGLVILLYIPLNWMSLSALRKIPGTIFASLTVSFMN